jgi:hypothetical protein
MNKQTAALIALYAGWMLTAANATTYEDIAGQWCGDVTDYVFTPDTLTVKFHDARPANVFKVTYRHGAAGERRQTAPSFPSLLRPGRREAADGHVIVPGSTENC